jgi:hypothetical protein
VRSVLQMEQEGQLEQQGQQEQQEPAGAAVQH